MPQPAKNRFVEIGRVGRPHGLDGKVRILPNIDFTDDLLSKVSVLYMRNSRSDMFPVRIESVHKETKNNQQSFFVKFDLIANRDQAEEARDKALFAEKEDLDAFNKPFSDPLSVLGYAAWFENREIGRVLEVIENPAHPILEIKIGSGSLLIPSVDEYIENIDHKNAIVYCINLDQLTDL